MPRKSSTLEARKRSEVVTVRLDPRLKYLAAIAARKQRRPLSGYIEWAVERSLEAVDLSDGDSTETYTVAEAERRDGLWDIDEPTRVSRLAINLPELLTYDEQLVWRLVRECGHVWRGKFAESDLQWTWTISAEKLILDRLREHWETFKKVAAGELSENALPDWQRYLEKADDDEVPF